MLAKDRLPRKLATDKIQPKRRWAMRASGQANIFDTKAKMVARNPENMVNGMMSNTRRFVMRNTVEKFPIL